MLAPQVGVVVKDNHDISYDRIVYEPFFRKALLLLTSFIPSSKWTVISPPSFSPKAEGHLYFNWNKGDSNT